MPKTGAARVSSLKTRKSSSESTPTNCQNALLMLFDLHNILNEYVHVVLCLEEECGV